MCVHLHVLTVHVYVYAYDNGDQSKDLSMQASTLLRHILTILG